MGKITSPDQHVFIKGRLMVDELVVADEPVNMIKKTNKDFLIFKIDF